MKLTLLLSFFVAMSLSARELPLKFIEDNCQKCHNSKKKKGGVDFTEFKTAEDFWKNSKTWKTSIELVQTGEMRPKKELTQKQIEYFSNSVINILDSDNFKVEDWFGRASLRRLSPIEIEHSLSDISRVEFDFAKNFPLDSGGGEGFSNNADTMRITPVFFEKLSIAAEKFASHAKFSPKEGFLFSKEPHRPLTNDQYYTQAKVDIEDFYNTRSAKMIRHENRRDMEKYIGPLLELLLRDRKSDMDSIQKLAKKYDLVPGAVWLWTVFLKDTEAEIKKRPRMGFWARWAFKEFNEALKNNVRDEKKVKEVADRTTYKIRYFLNNQSQVFKKFRMQHWKVNSEGLYRINIGTMHDGSDHDYINLENAHFQLENGKKIYLTTLKPQKIQGQVHIGKNGKGEKAVRLNGGSEVKNVIGFKAPAQVFFEIPKGTKSFKFDAHMDAVSKGKSFVQVIGDTKKDTKLVTEFVTEGVTFAGPGESGAKYRNEVDNFSLYMQYRYYPNKSYINKVINSREKQEIENYDYAKHWTWQLNNYTWRAFARKYKLKQVPDGITKPKLSGKAAKAYNQHKKHVDHFNGEFTKNVSAGIREFGNKLFRRPLSESDVKHWFSLFWKEYEKTQNFQQTVQDLVVSMVLHPSFIYRFEENRTGKVSDFELATRLSYFLWSSTPDNELLKLAEKGKLRDEATLDKQISRMLKDEKAERLGEEFFMVWLHVDKIFKDKIPNKSVFPTYNDKLKKYLVQEVKEFAKHLVREDQAVDSLITAKHSFVNEDLAKHYGIKNFAGKSFKKVNLSKYKRGGILGMAAIHVISSYPERTSPVLRGQWILETLIGAPVPPPPENVELSEATMIDKSLTIKEKLAKHREVKSCAICHDRIDPLGFSMENFDAIGRWRTHENDKLIDVEGELKNGTKLDGMEGLQKHLATKGKEDFLEHFTNKLLGFGLGRGLDYPDKSIVRSALDRAKKKDYQFSELVKGLIMSPAFLTRKAPPELSQK